jgi:hypothetical protein
MAMRPVRRRVLVLSVSFLLCASLAYLGSIAVRTASAYSEQKRGQGWVGHVYEAEPELGFHLVPGARGSETFPIGPDVAACVDADGFRVPADARATTTRVRPLVLALGCSYTYGAACEAQEIFPYLVAQRLHGSCVNAGCSSYGLAQMLILARRLIPLYRPDYVLFQHSPWLAERSRTRFAPVFFGSLSIPCFDADSGGVKLCPPAFHPIVFDLPVERYLHSPPGVLDFLSFELRVGIPLIFHDDVERCLLRRREPPLHPPSSEVIAESVHAEVAALCAKHGARLVLVAVGKSCQPVPIEDSAAKLGCLVVDAEAALCARLPDMDKGTYLLRYGRWGGDPPVLVDAHPNPLAHSIIAQAILEAIGGSR